MVQACLLVAAPEDAAVCGTCHPKETAAYLKSAMGNSIAPPSPLPDGRIVRQASGIEISVSEREGGMIHSINSNGLTAQRPVAYQIGAGKIGYTYMVQIGDYFFESPASWYRQHGWDVSPGYEGMASVDAGISAWQEPPPQFRARDHAVAALVIGGKHGISSLRETSGRQPDRIAIVDRYLAWNPQNIWFRQLKGTQSVPTRTGFEEIAAQATKAREANNTSQAIERYRQALELNPTWTEGWWFLGTLSYDTDEYETGRKAFAEFVKLDAKAAPGWSFLGLCEFETGEYANALEHIRRALEIGTGLQPAVEQVLRFHEALALARLGLFDQALPKFMPFVRRGLHNPEITAGIGLTALRQPLLPKEIAAGQRDLVMAVGQTAYSWMAGDESKTSPAFRSLMSAYPNAPGVHYLYATYLLSFRPAEEALVELKRELEINPRNADARATIALLMVRAGASSAAAPYARQAAQDGPTSPIAQYTYGLILAANGDLREAIERLETAERLDPANVEYHMALAGAYSKAGRHAEARRERQISITLAKGSDSHGPG